MASVIVKLGWLLVEDCGVDLEFDAWFSEAETIVIGLGITTLGNCLVTDGGCLLLLTMATMVAPPEVVNVRAVVVLVDIA